MAKAVPMTRSLGLFALPTLKGLNLGEDGPSRAGFDSAFRAGFQTLHAAILVPKGGAGSNRSVGSWAFGGQFSYV